MVVSRVTGNIFCTANVISITTVAQRRRRDESMMCACAAQYEIEGHALCSRHAKARLLALALAGRLNIKEDVKS